MKGCNYNTYGGILYLSALCVSGPRQTAANVRKFVVCKERGKIRYIRDTCDMRICYVEMARDSILCVRM